MNYKKRKNISLGIAAAGLVPLITFLIVVLIQPKHVKGQLPIDAYLKLGFGIGLLCALGGVAVIWLWEFQTRSARRKQMWQLAAELGYSYTESTNIPPDLLTKYPLFVEFGYVYSIIQNAIQGKVGKLDACVFDYRHPEYLSSGGSTHSGQVWKFFDTVIVTRSKDLVPSISTYPYGLDITEIKTRLDALANDHE